MLDRALRMKESFDIVGRDILIGGKKKIRLYFIDGFCKDELMERVMAYLMQIKEKEFSAQKQPEALPMLSSPTLKPTLQVSRRISSNTFFRAVSE